MDLSVRDAAKLLQVSEKTIYRWIGDGKLPAFRVHDQYRFNRVELLEWATARRLNVSPEIFTEPIPEAQLPTLAEALQAGGIYYRLGGNTKDEVLAALVEQMRLPEAVDRKFLLQVMQAREDLGSTAIGEGIALPHVRNPVVLHVEQPAITLGFLENPVPFGALDGQPVHALFALVSPTVRAHLHMLSRLGFVLRDPGLKALLKEQATREKIIAAVAVAEKTLSDQEAGNEAEA
ncbi:MAG: PTS sugar transporter subunit IIA [candidate division FCPU426 bacterium]